MIPFSTTSRKKSTQETSSADDATDTIAPPVGTDALRRNRSFRYTYEDIKMSKTPLNLNGRTILVTGSPGFIGANLVMRLRRELTSGTVISFDNMNDYYDPELKEYRLRMINAIDSPVRHVFIRGSIADKSLVDEVFAIYKPSIVVNLAAQAGVRYSIDHPDVYIESATPSITRTSTSRAT